MKCYYCGKKAHKELDVVRGITTYICKACDKQPNAEDQAAKK